jgi:hypothetical protein
MNVGWMTAYQGLKGDRITGGEYVKKHGFGHEIFNFRPFGGATSAMVPSTSNNFAVAASA